MKKLEKLYLDGNSGITGRGAMHLSQAIWEDHLVGLFDLKLGGTSLQESGVGAIAAAVLEGCPCLRELSFPPCVSTQRQ